MKKYLIPLAVAAGILVLIIIINPFGLFDALRDPFIRPNTVGLNLYGSYAVDTSGLREYDRIRSGNYAYKELNEPFTYFLQLPLDKDIIDTSLRDLQFELPDELLDYVYSSEANHEYMLISIGRPLKEIKYKTTSYYNHIKAEITFEEQHQNDMAYVYFIDKNVFFWTSDYYVMDGSQQKFLGHGLYFVY